MQRQILNSFIFIGNKSVSRGICRYSCLHLVYFSFHFNPLDKERGRPFQLLTSPRESRAGVKDSSPLPRPETLQHVEDMAKKLLIHDEVAAVMRHCRRVSSSSEITISNTTFLLVCFFLPLNKSQPDCLWALVSSSLCRCMSSSDRCVCRRL